MGVTLRRIIPGESTSEDRARVGQYESERLVGIRGEARRISTEFDHDPVGIAVIQRLAPTVMSSISGLMPAASMRARTSSCFAAVARTAA